MTEEAVVDLAFVYLTGVGEGFVVDCVAGTALPATLPLSDPLAEAEPEILSVCCGLSLLQPRRARAGIARAMIRRFMACSFLPVKLTQ
jgi:hypothetical protein